MCWEVGSCQPAIITNMRIREITITVPPAIHRKSLAVIKSLAVTVLRQMNADAIITVSPWILPARHPRSRR